MENLTININVSPDTYLKDPNTSELGRMILTNSIELIYDLGFEAFTFKKLGVKIGSPESSIYRYFESKHMLLIYLTNWYWSWMEYKIVFAINNISSPKKKLLKAIEELIEPVGKDKNFSHIDEVLLDKVIVNEGMKAYHIKEVDKENKKGYYKIYKRVVKRVSDLVLEVNPKFDFPHMLITTIIESSKQQKYFAEHLPSLTDLKYGKDTYVKFYTHMLFKTITRINKYDYYQDGKNAIHGSNRIVRYGRCFG